MFSDCTESVFRNSDRFPRQLVYGIDHWTDRFDGAIARPAAGHGIAIGDVNGDEFRLEPWAIPFASLAGVGILLLVLAVSRRIGRLHGRYAKWMLVGSLGSSQKR